MWRTGTTVSLQGAKWEEGGRFLVPGDYTFVATWDLRFPGRSLFIIETGEWGSKYFRNVLNFTFSTPEDSTMEAETLCSCFVVYFITLPKTQSQTSAWMLIDDLGRIWKKILLAVSRHYPGICLDGLRKTTKKVQNTKNLCKINRWPTQKFETIFPRKIFRNITAMYPVRRNALSLHKHRLLQTNRSHRNKALCLRKIAIIWKNLLVSLCVRIAPYSVLIK